MRPASEISQEKLEELIVSYILEINKKFKLNNPMSMDQIKDLAKQVAENLFQTNSHIGIKELQSDPDLKKRLVNCIANAMVNSQQIEPGKKLEMDLGELFNEKINEPSLKEMLKKAITPLCKPGTTAKQIDEMVDEMIEKMQDKQPVATKEQVMQDLILETQVLAMRNLFGGVNPKMLDSIVMVVLVNNGNAVGIAAQNEGNENLTSAVQDASTINLNKADPLGLEAHVIDDALALGDAVDSQFDYNNRPHPTPYGEG